MITRLLEHFLHISICTFMLLLLIFGVWTHEYALTELFGESSLRSANFIFSPIWMLITIYFVIQWPMMDQQFGLGNAFRFIVGLLIFIASAIVCYSGYQAILDMMFFRLARAVWG